MCGIFACSDAAGQDVSYRTLEGLQRLRYRGYDSFGFAGSADNRLHIVRSLDPLEPENPQTGLIPATAMISHTRWATHGVVDLENCHPRASTNGEFALIHNGVVENYQSLVPACASDTTVITHLYEQALQAGAHRMAALQSVMARLAGENTVVALFSDGEIVGSRSGPPLHMGLGENRVYLASDVLSFAGFAQEHRAVLMGETFSITGQQVQVADTTGSSPSIDWQHLETATTTTGSGEFRHYMLKEISEQWSSLPGRTQLWGIQSLADYIGHDRQVFLTGAGGAFITAMQIAELLRRIAGTRAVAVPAYEFGSIAPLVRPGDVCLAVSQSGETADTIAAVRVAQKLGCVIASHTNMPMSTLASLAQFPVQADAGTEICVLSTKSATAQIAFGYLLAHTIRSEEQAALGMLDQLSRLLIDAVCDETLRSIAETGNAICGQSHLYILGQGVHLATAAMAALNIKEASYIHAEAFSSGELKHGVLALIEIGTPIMLYQEQGKPMHNAAAEVKARGAQLIGVGTKANDMFDHFIKLPEVPDPALAAVLGIVPGQILAYNLALARGVNPDQPRNLAKSVTVL